MVHFDTTHPSGSIPSRSSAQDPGPADSSPADARAARSRGSDARHVRQEREAGAKFRSQLSNHVHRASIATAATLRSGGPEGPTE